MTDDELAGIYPELTLPQWRDRPFVAVSMVMSVDGASSLAGRSGKLGGSADGVAFSRLRDAADTILVGARTVVAEDYGPGVPPIERQQARRSRGLPPAPLLAIFSGTLNLAPTAKIFSDPDHRPLIITNQQAVADRGQALAEVADIVALPDTPSGWPSADDSDQVHVASKAVTTPRPMAQLLDVLAAKGRRRVLCEGGPVLNGLLFAEDFIDELFLTVAPQLVAGSANRIIDRPQIEGDRRLALLSARKVGDELLLRYRRQRTVDDIDDAGGRQ